MRADPVPELKRQLAEELVRAMDGWTSGELMFRIHIARRHDRGGEHAAGSARVGLRRGWPVECTAMAP